MVMAGCTTDDEMWTYKYVYIYEFKLGEQVNPPHSSWWYFINLFTI